VDASPLPTVAAAVGASGPADYESKHFLLHTDMSPKEAQDLLNKLETMISMISKYWGRPPAGVIECNVVRDLSRWPPGRLDPEGVAKIQQEAGVTLTQTLSLGGQTVAAKAVVYAIAKPGVAQHEAVHAYCGQSFGTCGPLWYAEGMAELGQYWRAGERASEASVQIHPIVLQYLQTSPPQSLNDIVNTHSARSFTGDSWQNYAWRWALCHLLEHNTNYHDRFRPLGLGFLTEQKVSFEETYGPMAREISFEYLFFVSHIEQGFRVDLCSWDWKKKFQTLIDRAPVSARVAAGRGWQPSGATLRAGKEYEYSAAGTWKTGKERDDVTADGDAEGAGRLIGVLFKDYQLGEPFALGSYGKFTAPEDGQLFLRCQSKWGEIADNKGGVTVKIKPASVGDALPAPPGSKKLAADGGSQIAKVWPDRASASHPALPRPGSPAPGPPAPNPPKPAPADAAN
jgi:hypothetical protein